MEKRNSAKPANPCPTKNVRMQKNKKKMEKTAEIKQPLLQQEVKLHKETE
ncbi:hypothetical protein HYC85_020727 [Camellia sinensis]|uniref:Uncharacterized protein n=1 Tax=Camellia sinensis TaxID=4442 RepID=A0A7J7GSD1_CAMSI|nr:hypothetical protein HYC85_020727 [Camellia sinensis]